MKITHFTKPKGLITLAAAVILIIDPNLILQLLGARYRHLVNQGSSRYKHPGCVVIRAGRVNRRGLRVSGSFNWRVEPDWLGPGTGLCSIRVRFRICSLANVDAVANMSAS
jgi:hypothetical protein